ncbi:MAG: hypothetical protein KIS77_22000 [Saprospiraceae bacterium]|nr:hypothetical protein [Saprospiraceae bacterium]
MAKHQKQKSKNLLSASNKLETRSRVIRAAGFSLSLDSKSNPQDKFPKISRTLFTRASNKASTTASPLESSKNRAFSAPSATPTTFLFFDKTGQNVDSYM